MENKYSEIIKHIPNLEDHGHLYMYYGVPYSKECYVYGDDLCRSIASCLEYEFKWHEVITDNKIRLEDVFDVDVESQSFAKIAMNLYGINICDNFVGILIKAVK